VSCRRIDCQDGGTFSVVTYLVMYAKSEVIHGTSNKVLIHLLRAVRVGREEENTILQPDIKGNELNQAVLQIIVL